MRTKFTAAGCLVTMILLAVPAGADERTITCESRNFRYNYCRVDTDNRVYLQRQRSNTRCRQWDNWGYDGRGVWVDRGCAAEFKVGRGGGGAQGAAIAGAAIAGVAIAAAIAANRDKDHHSDVVPSWGVGTFRGYDDSERTDVELTVYPGGAVNGYAGGSSFSGRWDGNRLDAGRKRFRVERSGNGFVAIVSAGEMIPADGEIIEGVASVDESAITGESAPVIRESGGDRSAVTGGTRVLSDRIVVRVTSNPGETFLDRMIALVEGAERQKTPNEIALNILLAGLTIVFLIAVVTLQPLAMYSGAPQSLFVLVSLLVCLIPTTIGGLLSAIGIAGMDRLVQHNVLAMSGRAVEAAGDVHTLLLDKTGTITLGNRQATEFIAMPGVSEVTVADAAQLASLADETPEGRSVVVLAKQRYGLRGRELAAHQAVFVPFTAHTRMSGVEFDGRVIRKGAADAIQRYLQSRGGQVAAELQDVVDRIARNGGTPLVVAENGRALGVVHLKDVVKGGMRERFARLRGIGIRTVMITGDNPLTAAAIAAESGVDDFLAEATPEDKMALIRREQAQGKLVAMTGDGTNDAPALAQADVGVAMNTGTQAAKEAGNMVDLDSNPTKLIEIVEIGKQLLMTRGALTTFSIANDVAKYFAIVPAMFVVAFPALAALNVMGLRTPESAILSAVIFNALIIVALVPLALRGVRFRAMSAEALLRRNLLIYGVGGLVAPFAGIKAIDLVLTLLGLA